MTHGTAGISDGASDTEIVSDGLHFGEGVRLGPDGMVYLSDLYGHRVYRVDPATWVRELIAEVPYQPSGLGWLPDGRMLIVSMRDANVLRIEPSGELVLHAELSAAVNGPPNDMLVDSRGRAWISDFGFPYFEIIEKDPEANPVFGSGANPPTARVTRVDPDGSAHTVADGMQFPNGLVILDGSTLVVAETFGRRLTAFTVAEDGSLQDRRIWADLSQAGPEGTPITPDGIAVDPDGLAIWVADPLIGAAVCVERGGLVRRIIRTTQSCYSVLPLGDRLLCCTTQRSSVQYRLTHKTGLLELANLS